MKPRECGNLSSWSSHNLRGNHQVVTVRALSGVQHDMQMPAPHHLAWGPMHEAAHITSEMLLSPFRTTHAFAIRILRTPCLGDALAVLCYALRCLLKHRWLTLQATC
jgi:hypothetical protein